MCLAVPAKVVEIDGNMAVVEHNGVRQKITIALCPGVEVGKYVIVHAGCAIEVMDEGAAMDVLQTWNEIERELELSFEE
ncbi:MAG TPA: HypC/HybG/HupF family hydrogenase formation chaperone [Candidatus Lokiarchaeia archaeon]|nr:HypC/HybG/HupF family hydrogenase formation chaperone [Candidatus Lokiarchaeia archaeon]